MSLSISQKLMAIIALAIVAMVGLSTLKTLKLRDAITDGRTAAIKLQVESAMSIVAGFAARAESGEISRQAAEALAKAAIKAIRFGDNDYFFIVDQDLTGVVHPNPDIVGSDLSDVQDPNGTYLFRELRNQAGRGGGFVPYAWPRPGSDDPVDKISYAAQYDPWGWIVATGVYVDDVRAAVRAEVRDAIVMNAIAFTLLIGGCLLAARSITGPVGRLRDAIKAIEAGDLATPIKPASKDEVGEISKRLDQLRRTLQTKASVEEDAAQKAEEAKSVVQSLARKLKQLSRGNLDIQIKQTFPDDYEGLRQDFNEAITNLQKLSRTIEDIADVVSSNAREISSNTNHLAQEAERNSAALDQAAHSLDTISDTVMETAKISGETDQSVTSARKRANEGEEAIERTSASMDRIKESSSEISSVTAVIEDIAFQTNLLALNAGVEAARAGEAGRGFLIVAQEVRNLAGRCSEAVVNINALIDQANQQVNDGIEEFAQTREKLRAVIASFNDIQTNVSKINDSAQKQADGLTSLTDTVGRLQSTTQQNAASLEENSAGSYQLEAESEKLLQEVAHLNGKGTLMTDDADVAA